MLAREGNLAMAGVRSEPRETGKYQGWFTDYKGNRKFFIGTRSKAGTLRIAQRLEDEHRQVRLGYRPVPVPADKHVKRPVAEVIEEYLAWGRAQGGRGGRPWAATHLRKRRRLIEYWRERLGLETLGDLEGCLPLVEAALRELQRDGRVGKTLQNYADGIKSFCSWCVERGYLRSDPLQQLRSFNTSPRTRRRAITQDELVRLVGVAPEERELLYEVAVLSGLRAGELRSLAVGHLDVERSGLRLDGEWTKNRRDGFQPLPTALVRRLRSFAEAETAAELYRKLRKRTDERMAIPEHPLLYVPTHTAREMYRDLRAAGIEKSSPEGKLDFHSLRVAYITFVCEAGATVKEAQEMARHSTPQLTLNTYARARGPRLAELVEQVAEAAIPRKKRALYVHLAEVGGQEESRNAIDDSSLRLPSGGGGGGNRTPVP